MLVFPILTLFVDRPKWKRILSRFVISFRMEDYVQNPFCDRLFREPQARKPSGETPLEEHVITVHHKVRVRKGSNYKWMDESEVKKRPA